MLKSDILRGSTLPQPPPPPPPPFSLGSGYWAACVPVETRAGEECNPGEDDEGQPVGQRAHVTQQVHRDRKLYQQSYTLDGRRSENFLL